MTTEQIKNRVKELISKDQAEKALTQLLEFCRSNDGLEHIERTALINNGQLERLDKDRHEKRIDSEKYAVEKNKILSSLLSMIDDLEPVPAQVEPEQAPVTPSPNPAINPLTSSLHDTIFISVILLLLVSSIVAFFYFTFKAQYGQGGVFFSSASGTCLVYLNWRKKASVLSTQS